MRRSNGRIASARYVALAALLAAGAVPVTAQEEEPERECICIEIEDLPWHGTVRHVQTFGRRAMLGVSLDVAGEAGLRIDDVTEGGPADEAGLRPGDVLTAIDDVDLAGMEADDAYEALIEYLADDVEPGDTVEVVYERDGDIRRASIETSSYRGVFAFRGPEGVLRVRPDVERLRRAIRVPEVPPIPDFEFREPGVIVEGMLAAHRHGLRLVDMNEGLGRYFDTDRGVLVVDADDDPALGLRPGDVILSIDGREVEDSRHAYRILGSYRDGEAVRFELMRDGRRTTVTGKAP